MYSALYRLLSQILPFSSFFPILGHDVNFLQGYIYIYNILSSADLSTDVFGFYVFFNYVT